MDLIITGIPASLSGRPGAVFVLAMTGCGDGTRAYVTTWADGTVSVIDTATNTVAATVPWGEARSGSP
jgi:YVTN family beta-propeller protein